MHLCLSFWCENNIVYKSKINNKNSIQPRREKHKYNIKVLKFYVRGIIIFENKLKVKKNVERT